MKTYLDLKKYCLRWLLNLYISATTPEVVSLDGSASPTNEISPSTPSSVVCVSCNPSLTIQPETHGESNSANASYDIGDSLLI